MAKKKKTDEHTKTNPRVSSLVSTSNCCV